MSEFVEGSDDDVLPMGDIGADIDRCVADAIRAERRGSDCPEDEAVSAADGPIHVRPVGDVIAHEWEDCACLPDCQIVDGVVLFVHNAWDGRE